MQKVSHKGTPKEAPEKQNRRVVSINPPVAGHIDGYLVFAQGKDVELKSPLKNKADYITEALEAGMQALGFTLPTKEVAND